MARPLMTKEQLFSRCITTPNGCVVWTGRTTRKYGKKYSVDPSNIRSIRLRKRWRHI